jgi:hypothetical protein
MSKGTVVIVIQTDHKNTKIIVFMNPDRTSG